MAIYAGGLLYDSSLRGANMPSIVLDHWILVLVLLTVLVAVVVALWIQQTRRLLLWFLVGRGLQPAGKDGNHDLQALVGLLATILGGTVALGAGVQQTGRVNYWYVLLYALAGIIPLGGMLHIVHQSTAGFWETAKQVWRGQTQDLCHAHDATSVTFATSVWAVSFLFMALCVLLVWCERFPGQGRHNQPLYPSELKPVGAPEDTKLGYYLSVPVNKSIYDRGIPPNLTPNVRLAGSMLPNWEVYWCRVRDMSKGGATVAETFPYEASNAPGFYGIILPPLPSNGDLNIDIYLRKKKPDVDKDAQKALIDEVFHKRNLQVIDRPLP
jgi:hypothetical protein